MSSIARYRETLRLWGLADVPFRAAPLEDPAELDIRRLLYVARRSGGLSVDIGDATLEQLGVETFVELLPMLKSLEGDLLIRQEDGRLLPSALVPDEGEHGD